GRADETCFLPQLVLPLSHEVGPRQFDDLVRVCKEERAVQNGDVRNAQFRCIPGVECREYIASLYRLFGEVPIRAELAIGMDGDVNQAVCPLAYALRRRDELFVDCLLGRKHVAQSDRDDLARWFLRGGLWLRRF